MHQRWVRAGAAAGLLFLLACCPVRAAQAPPVPPAQVSQQATWDEEYLYLAFQVDDVDLAGTNTRPLSQPQQDDSVGVYLQIGAARPGAPDGNTHAMIVSAAGGFTFLRGDEVGKLAVRPLFSIKYAVALQGTLNRADDRDQRYTVEMAIPWSALGITPQAGAVLGYNVVVRERGRASGFASLSPSVQTADDVARPARWTTITLGGPGTAAPAGASVAARFAPRIAAALPPSGDRRTAAPLVDGVLKAGEWPEASRYAFAGPDQGAGPAVTATVPPPTVAAPVVPVVPIPTDSALGVERLLMARYALGFQGDGRKRAPFRGVRAPSGRFLLSDQPALGAGPWFSSDRVGWHRSQMSEMRRAGVDVALVCVGGPDRGGEAAGDEKALLVLVSALREMAAERVPAPSLALLLDTQAITPPGAAKPDLATEAGRALVYRAARRFFQIVPPELRARVQLPPRAGGAPAFPIVLSSASGVANARESAALVTDLRGRFAADFGPEATLLVAGGGGFDPATAPGLVAYVPLENGGKGSGAVATFVVQPGFDDAAVAAAEQRPTLRARREGETFRASWEAALAAKPTWVVLDSWNDFARGTEVAASRQYGTRYVDLTRIYATQLGGLMPRDVKWLAHNAPRQMRPDQIVSVEVQLQNVGATPLRGADGMALSYRWLQNGRVVGESPLRLALPGALFPTQSGTLTVGLAAVRPGSDGKLTPLAPGEYTLQFDLTQTAGPDATPLWFGENGDTPLRVPVTITPDVPAHADFAASIVTPLLHTGRSYPAGVRVRWMGPQPLPAASAQLTYQLTSLDGARTIATGSTPLGQDLSPGQWTTLRAPLRTSDPGGSALPPAFPELTDPSALGYRLRWLLTRVDEAIAVPGVYSERVALYPGDEEARVLVPPGLPAQITAGQLVPMRVTIVNRGSAAWSAGTFLVDCHWYYPDGVEAVWKGALPAVIAKSVAPGQSTQVTVSVRAPERDGPYVLAFDVGRGPDDFLSTRPVTRTGDIGLAYVRVVGGRLQYADLERFFDTDAVARESNPGDGDLDGTGASLPAESFPPDRYGASAPAPLGPKQKAPPAPAYPSGYYADVSPVARRISFRYGPSDDGAKNAMSCQGQTIPVGKDRYVGLHLSALATGGRNETLALTLRYKDGATETVTRSVADWSGASGNNEPIAILARRKRTKEGDVPATCALRHLIVPVSPAKELVSVTLPSNPAIKIFALTLER